MTATDLLVAGPRVEPVSTPALWAARLLSALPVVFLTLDGVAKVMKLGPVLDACAKLEIPERAVPGMGMVLVAATLLYAVPWTSVLGAVVLTGYLGGAVWTHVRVGDPAFPVVFPCVVAAMLWGGLYLREPRLRALLPVRRSRTETTR
jgi:hypothetical protein